MPWFPHLCNIGSNYFLFEKYLSECSACNSDETYISISTIIIRVMVITCLTEYKLIRCRGQQLYLPCNSTHIISVEHITVLVNT